jgi:glucosamine-6-phosphate deaminase
MKASKDQVIRFPIGTIKFEVHPNRKSAGESAARAAAEEMQPLAQSQKELAAIFATGASQFDTFAALTALPGLPWQKVVGFHLDEYVALDKSHPASFRRSFATHHQPHVLQPCCGLIGRDHLPGHRIRS